MCACFYSLIFFSLVFWRFWQYYPVKISMEVSFTIHSHIIGRGGQNINTIMRQTSTKVHFPDGNRIVGEKKSNTGISVDTPQCAHSKPFTRQISRPVSIQHPAFNCSWLWIQTRSVINPQRSMNIFIATDVYRNVSNRRSASNCFLAPIPNTPPINSFSKFSPYYNILTGIDYYWSVWDVP